MLIKIAFYNIKRKGQDYLICLLSLILFAVLMLSAFMLPTLASISKSSDAFISNSLPTFIIMTLLFFMLYMNNFMLKRRSQEFAIYMLSGISKKNICFLFLLENVFLSLIALTIGLIIGFIILGVVFAIYNITWTFSGMISAILQSSMFFIIAYSCSLVITVVHFRQLTIKKVIDLRRINEHNNTSKCQLTIISIITVITFGIYYYQIKHFNLVTVSTLFFSIGIILYGSYASIFGWLSLYRNRRGNLLYRNHRLFILSQLMSKSKTIVRMSSIISGCLLTAICSFIAGWILTKSDRVLIEKQMDVILGFAQFYISILFTIIVFSIIALNQIIDMREHNQKFAVLKQLGTDSESLKRTLFTQVFLNFTIPILMALIIVLCSLYPLEQSMNTILNGKHLLKQGALYYSAIFVFLYFSYMITTYIMIYKAKTQSLLRQS